MQNPQTPASPSPQQLSAQIDQLYEQDKKSLSLSDKEDICMHILRARDWSMLRELNLGRCGLRDGDLREIVEMDFPVLQTLSFYYNEITHIGLQVLLSKNWPQLTWLNLYQNSLQNPGLNLLLTTPSLPKLRILSLGRNNATWVGFTALPECQCQCRWQGLQELFLNQNKIGVRGVKLLVKAQMPALRILWLYDCNIGNQGAKHITKSQWPNLQKFWPSYLNNLTIDGYTSLSQNSWKSLTHLDIGRLEPIELFGLIGPGWTSKADLKYRMDDWGFVRGFQRIMSRRRSW